MEGMKDEESAARFCALFAFDRNKSTNDIFFALYRLDKENLIAKPCFAVFFVNVVNNFNGIIVLEEQNR